MGSRMMGNNEGRFFSWSEAFLTITEMVGGKGWNSARLDRYGFEIPRGGVLSATVYGHFLEANGLRSIVQELWGTMIILLEQSRCLKDYSSNV